MSGQHCPHCNAQILLKKGGKAKLRTSMVVLHEGGDVEINCPSCREPVLLPVAATDQPIRKAAPGPRYVVPLDK